MSKEQIEELAKKLKAYCYDIELSDIDDCRRLADFIIDTLGYLKQSEGRWEKRVFIVFDSEMIGYRCSECNTTWDTETPYCPHCGAKMKGGAE